jgi:hypothetical protein
MDVMLSDGTIANRRLAFTANRKAAALRYINSKYGNVAVEIYSFDGELVAYWHTN